MKNELDENQQNFNNEIFSFDNNHINQNSQNEFQNLPNILNDLQNNYQNLQYLQNENENLLLVQNDLQNEFEEN